MADPGYTSDYQHEDDRRPNKRRKRMDGDIHCERNSDDDEDEGYNAASRRAAGGSKRIVQRGLAGTSRDYEDPMRMGLHHGGSGLASSSASASSSSTIRNNWHNKAKARAPSPPRLNVTRPLANRVERDDIFLTDNGKTKYIDSTSYLLRQASGRAHLELKPSSSNKYSTPMPPQGIFQKDIVVDEMGTINDSLGAKKKVVLPPNSTSMGWKNVYQKTDAKGGDLEDDAPERNELYRKTATAGASSKDHDRQDDDRQGRRKKYYDNSEDEENSANERETGKKKESFERFQPRAGHYKSVPGLAPDEEKLRRAKHDYLMSQLYRTNEDGLAGPAKFVPQSDLAALRQAHRFLRDDEGSEDNEDDEDDPRDLFHANAERLAKKYYDKLYREYVLADLRGYKENKIGFRWRTEQEVLSGKGQFVCGNKRCDRKLHLQSYEVNFVYVEQNKQKQALVKIRLCTECAFQLNYVHLKKKRREMKEQEKLAKKKDKKQSKMKNVNHENICREAVEEEDKAELDRIAARVRKKRAAKGAQSREDRIMADLLD
ncbi:unnamed protein product [Amoebophrya sp. A25]|nr:unnamed protein product [Amoebophrya sp. A25]|eukprot:GSA25T00009338001.1